MAGGKERASLTRQRRLLHAACLVLFFGSLFTGYDARAAGFIRYLYVEANEGDSSGGHAAIRFEGETFHFQHESCGLIRVRRVDSAAFDHSYAALGNRTIHESAIAVSDETYARLHDSFTSLFLIQNAQLDILDGLRRDLLLFELLLKHGGGRSDRTTFAWPVRGLGYFAPDTVATVTGDSGPGDRRAPSSSPALARLRERVLATYGEGFFQDRLAHLTDLLQNAELRAASFPAPGIARGTYPPAVPFASKTFDDLLLALSALRVLQSPPLVGRYLTSQTESFALSAEEGEVLAAFAGKIEDDLVRLVTSTRSDWGFPFLAGMARLAAIDASLASGRMLLLDLFPDEDAAPGREASTVRYVPVMKKRAEELFRQRRQEFFEKKEMRESDYAAMELAGNRLVELERALAAGTSPRRGPETAVPSRTGSPRLPVLPAMNEELLMRELASARAAEKNYAAKLFALYSYDLVGRNCVTEIFTSINGSLAALAGEGSAEDKVAGVVVAESQKQLGGYVDPSGGLTFVPFVSAGRVEACYAVVARQELLSYRARKLAEMKKQESALLVFLRESNTVTSTIYRRPPGDSPFLFFTDDTVVLRPLFGACNLALGAGDSLLGLMTLPWDGGGRLRLAAKGMLFSLPELFFVNLRKGSMEYVEER